MKPGDIAYVVFWKTGEVREVTYLGQREPHDEYFDSEVYDPVEKVSRRTNLENIYETREAAERVSFLVKLSTNPNL